jgi:hypothetical protein
MKCPIKTRLDDVLKVSNGTMRIDVVIREDELEEYRERLKGRKGNKLINLVATNK